MMNLNDRRGIPLDHTGIPQDTLLPLLLAVSPAITRISQQVLPIATSPTPQSGWHGELL